MARGARGVKFNASQHQSSTDNNKKNKKTFIWVQSYWTSRKWIAMITSSRFHIKILLKKKATKMVITCKCQNFV